MNILPKIKIIDLSLYLENEKILVISDLHLGIETTLNEKGFLIPRFQFQEIKSRLTKIITQINPDLIVINGDLKHEFGKITNQEYTEILELFDLLRDKRVIVIEGNHDKILEPITNKRNITLISQYETDKITITHGDIIPKNLKKIVIIGHEHPAISFKDRPNEKYKCFLKGKYKNHDLIILPSFSFLSEGTDITKEKPLSPFLQQSLSDFEVYIVEDKLYKFGKVKDIT